MRIDNPYIRVIIHQDFASIIIIEKLVVTMHKTPAKASMKVLANMASLLNKCTVL